MPSSGWVDENGEPIEKKTKQEYNRCMQIEYVDTEPEILAMMGIDEALNGIPIRQDLAGKEVECGSDEYNNLVDRIIAIRSDDLRCELFDSLTTHVVYEL